MRKTTLLAVCIALACPAPAVAQFDVGVAGGASIPVGDLADGVDVGWHAMGTVALTSLMQPMSLRLDGAYNSFGLSDEGGPDAGESVTVISGTLNLAYRLPLTDSPFSPYVIAGLGGYNSDCTAEGCEGTTKFGWNAGAGTKLYFLGFRWFLEARYHSTDRGGADVSYVPITLGVLF
ncbi:MAG TPA: outer membrane beta-barrel protein [Longimicrobiales bacterium]